MVAGSDALGLAGLLPGPGWVILDAARDQRFTGELVAVADEEIRVYFDRGRIYVAERASDPPLGTRLVDAGALNRAQLEYGTLKIGPIEHLGRLFDRVPSVNRDGVLVINELMTEQCVRWLATQPLHSVVVTPYRHHESGMHRWEIVETAGSTSTGSVPPEMELPAPPPDATPVIAAEPADDVDATAPSTTITVEPAVEPAVEVDVEPAVEPAVEIDVEPAVETDVEADAEAVPEPPSDEEPTDRPAETAAAPAGDPAATRRFEPYDDPLVDDVVQWDEPSSFDAPTREHRSGSTGRTRRDLLADPDGDDWIDALDHGGVADAPTASARGQLPPLEVRRSGPFELIWPSGETDDLPEEAVAAADHDRVGPAARVASQPAATEPVEPAVEEFDAPLPRRGAMPEPSAGPDAESYAGPEMDDGSDNTLAVRRAVATIDTGSLDARRRLAATPPPGRLVVEREHHLWRTDGERTTTSVFDEQPAAEPEPVTEVPSAPTDHEARSGALRRLISNLRRG